MIATVFDTKFEEVENKILDDAKYLTIPEFNKFPGTIFDTKLKQASLATNSVVNTVSQCANKKKEKSRKIYKCLI